MVAVAWGKVGGGAGAGPATRHDTTAAHRCSCRSTDSGGRTWPHSGCIPDSAWSGLASAPAMEGVSGRSQREESMGGVRDRKCYILQALTKHVEQNCEESNKPCSQSCRMVYRGQGTAAVTAAAPPLSPPPLTSLAACGLSALGMNPGSAQTVLQ